MLCTPEHISMADDTLHPITAADSCIELEATPSGNAYEVKTISEKLICPVTTLALALARILDTHATALEPLNNSVSIDVINQLQTRTSAQLTFTHEECEITLWSTGEIYVTPPQPFQTSQSGT